MTRIARSLIVAALAISLSGCRDIGPIGRCTWTDDLSGLAEIVSIEAADDPHGENDPNRRSLTVIFSPAESGETYDKYETVSVEFVNESGIVAGSSYTATALVLESGGCNPTDGLRSVNGVDIY